MGAIYALNLNFDPASTSGQFQSFNSSNNSGRAWWKSTDGGGSWTFAGNPDSYTPLLSLSNADTVQFAILPVSSSPAVQTAAITVVFARDRQGGNNPARIASPFQLANGMPRCVLADPPGTWNSAYLIGPYGLAVNRGNSGSGRLRFEFAVAAHVTFADGTVKEYGYDPEMDVDV